MAREETLRLQVTTAPIMTHKVSPLYINCTNINMQFIWLVYFTQKETFSV